MREIRFRGYAKEEMIGDQWLYGFGIYTIEYVGGTKEWHLHTLNGTYEVVPESIGQYTGLKDKNGNEVYEGDILTNGGVFHYIRWDDGRAGFKFNEKKSWSIAMVDLLTKAGNIYENPELVR